MEAEALRNAVRSILGGGGFDERNEFEDERRATAASSSNGAGGFKPKSRRAQQAMAKAKATGASPVDAKPTSESKGGLEKLGVVGSSSPASVKPAAHVLLPTTASWWEEVAVAPESAQPTADAVVRERAADAYEAEVAAFALLQKKKHGSDQKMVQRLTEAGTAKDKIAALTLQAQESSFHCLPHVRQLLSLAERPRAEVKLAATEALAELFLTRLLPSRPLLPFEKHPLTADAARVAAAAAAERAGKGNEFGKSGELPLRLLLQAHFEDELKLAYARLVGAVEGGTHDPLLHVRQRMVGRLYGMLCAKPELERRVLSLLVNKLGDPDKKVSSRLAHLLGQLTVAHPAMKGVVLAECQRFVLRPNVSEAAQYYAVTFMNQMILTRREPHLAHTLLLIYLALFSARVSSGAPLGSRMFSCLLSGLHRAIPFCDDPSTKEQTAELLSSQLTSIFRCAHASSFGTAVQALMVLSHATGFAPSASDRFYRALYESVLHPDLPTSSKQALFLNVVYKAMKADDTVARVAAFAKRLLQACAHAPPSFTCGVLMLLAEVSKSRTQLRKLLTAPPSAANGTGAVVDTGAAHAAAPAAGTTPSPDALGMGYDWNKREPKFAGAEGSRLWELTPLLHHYHPSVVQFAQCVARAEPISYAGDPLRDFGLMPFLDKFVFKNPKAAKRQQKGGSIMQPVVDGAGRLGGGPEALAMNSRGAVASMLGKPLGKIASDERFFHTYFSQKRSAEERLQKGRPPRQRSKTAAEGVDEDDGGNDGKYDDEDGEEDAFATRLAQSLLDDDFYDEEEDGEEDDGEEDEEDEGGEEGEEEEEEEDIDEAAVDVADAKKSSKQKRKRGGPTFMDAEEFAAMLEAAGDTNEGRHPKLTAWEEGGGGKGKGKRMRHGR